MEPILSDDELQDIMEAANERGSESEEVAELSLTANRRFEHDASGTWNEAAKSLKPPFTSAIIGATGERQEVDILDIATLDEDGLGADAIREMENDDWTYCSFESGSVRLIMGISKMLARSYIARRIGNGKRPLESPRMGEPFTSLERRILLPCFDTFVLIVGDVVPGNLVFKQLPKTPSEVLQSRDKAETWLEMSVRCKEDPDLGVWMAGPALLFSPKFAHKVGTMSMNVHGTTVEVSADLGNTRMTLQKFQQLKPGEIVQLDSMLGDPLSVSIAGVPKLVGHPINSRGNVAIQISGRMEREGANASN